jgi:hypothetical protein
MAASGHPHAAIRTPGSAGRQAISPIRRQAAWAPGQQPGTAAAPRLGLRCHRPGRRTPG